MRTAKIGPDLRLLCSQNSFLNKIPHCYCQYCEYNLHKSNAKGMCEEEKLVSDKISFFSRK